MDDQTAIEAFARVDELRKQLREAEAHLKLEVAAFSKRRNYGCNLREYQVRSQLELMNKGVAA
jgi:hypothetical protein